jgi:hypothetical protein
MSKSSTKKRADTTTTSNKNSPGRRKPKQAAPLAIPLSSHIPPFLLRDGSLELDVSNQITPNAARTVFTGPPSKPIERIRIVSEEGDILYQNFLAGSLEVRVWLTPNFAGSPDITIRNNSSNLFEMTSRRPFGPPVRHLKPTHPRPNKFKHPDLVAGQHFQIEGVGVLGGGSPVFFDSTATGYTIVIFFVH